jgi:D-inositol-3-phosphate glycosyltransferase
MTAVSPNLPIAERRLPKRIAMLSLHTSPLAQLGGRETGGMNVYVREVAAELGTLGIAVDVYTRRSDPDAPAIEEFAPGARLVRIDAGPPRRIEKEEMIGLTRQFAEGVATSCDVNELTYDLIHSHYWLSVEAGEILADRWGVPHVGMFHTLGDVKLRARASEAEPEERLEAERRLVHRLDRIVAATRNEQQLLRQIFRVPPERVAVIPLGVNLRRFAPGDRAAARAGLGIGEAERILLAIGRIQPLKGLDILIRSLAEVTDRDGLSLWIIGGDDRAESEIERLRALAQEFGVAPMVRFVGPVDHEALPAYYHAADVVVMPSFYESFGLVAVEAMASGVPVVASRVGGLSSTVSDGRTGYLIPWRCPEPFAEKIEVLLRNEQLRSSLGAAAAERMQTYSWPEISRQLCELYEDLISGDHAVGAARAAATARGV